MRIGRNVFLAITTVASAFAADAPEILGSVGYFRAFLDEPGEFAGGAALRIPVVRRLAIRPEFIVSNQRGYTHALVIGSATVDVSDPHKPVVAYISGGGGFIRTHAKSIGYSYSEGLALAGAGVRFVLGDRWTAGSEFRLGTSGFPLITFNIGIRLGEK
jgi:hypothetical protein